MGQDFKFGNRREGTINDISRNKIDVIGIKEIKLGKERISSTTIRDALSEGDLIKAHAYMGRSYCISGKVIHGEKLGREIGYPTANIHMLHNRPPLKGVFAVKLGDNYGVANLGTRPTIAGISKLHLEVHLFNFTNDIYGQHVRVTFLKKIRDEIKFKSINDLKKHIQIDFENAKTYIKNYDRLK